MEISLLTGVHLILTIFDKEEGKIIQYLSDSVEKFRVINQMEEVQVRKRYVKDNQQNNAHDNEDDPSGPYENADASQDQIDGNDAAGAAKKRKPPPQQYITQKIQSEIYTNDHVSKHLMICLITCLI